LRPGEGKLISGTTYIERWGGGRGGHDLGTSDAESVRL
jgi:hypothetical protein